MQWHPTLVLLPGKSHGWRSLVGCSPGGREESDTTERLHFHFSLSLFTFIHWRRKWQPTPAFLLENPRDGVLGGLLSMGSNRERQDWSDLAAAVFTCCKQCYNEYCCISFFVHVHESLDIIFERVQYEKWMVKDTLVTRG